MGTASVVPIRLMTMTTASETLGAFFPKQMGMLAVNGFAIHATSAPGPGLEKLKRVPGVTTHGVPMARTPDPVRDAVSLWTIFRLIRRLRPQIVHAHTPKAGLLGMIAARAAGVPIRLYTIHGLPLLTRRGVWRRVLECFERTSCWLSTGTYSVSPSLEKMVLDLGLCPKQKLATLGDGSCAGIDLDVYDADADLKKRAAAIRATYGIPQDATLLTFAGRIAKDKGIAILSHAWSELAHEFPDLYLLFAGALDSTDPVPESGMELLRNHRRVRFTDGWINDMPAVYAATTVCVLPTYREGLSQVAMEAGAMGVPIVSTRVPGVVDHVRDGVTGLLVPPGEAQPLIEALRRVIRSGDLCASLGRAARAHIRSRFSDSRVNGLWLAEYQRLVRVSDPDSFKSAARIESREARQA